MKDQIEEAISQCIGENKSFPGMTAKEIQDAAILDIKEMYDLLQGTDVEDFFGPSGIVDVPDRLESFSERLKKYSKAMRERI
jgi:hypothetical protein